MIKKKVNSNNFLFVLYYKTWAPKPITVYANASGYGYAGLCIGYNSKYTINFAYSACDLLVIVHLSEFHLDKLKDFITFE